MTTLEPAIADEIAGRVSSATVIRRDEPMAKHTTLRVGGPAEVYVEPASETDLAAVLKFCGERGVKFFILGRGSNLLVRDGGFRGVVICLSQPEFSKIEIAGERLRCGAGARLKNVAVEARRNWLERAGISRRHSRQPRRRVADERRRDGQRDVRCRRIRARDEF